MKLLTAFLRYLYDVFSIWSVASVLVVFGLAAICVAPFAPKRTIEIINYYFQ